MADENLPERDDAKSGEVTYTPEYLRKHPKKLAELLKAPDGTPGKDVAETVDAAAPIVADAVKLAKRWDRLNAEAKNLTKSLADKLAELRTVYRDSSGEPDMTGTSWAYREAAMHVYTSAGLDDDKRSQLTAAVRYHVSDSVRGVLREWSEGSDERYNELCTYYKLNPLTVNQRRLAGTTETGTRLPALRLAADNPIKALPTGVHYAARVFQALPEEVPDGVPDREREAMRAELETVRDRAEELLEALGEARGEEDEPPEPVGAKK